MTESDEEEPPYERDSLDYTPEMAVREAIADLEGKYAKDLPSRALVIMLWDDKPGQYETTFWNAGLSSSQAIALLEKTKMEFLSYLCGLTRRKDEE
jgi:hypothetical protein